LSDELANASIRIGLGRFTTAAEVEFAADALAAATSGLTEMRSAPR
jgi:cysteine sulfinate desulfinase/cysteine desulfurase-like protein